MKKVRYAAAAAVGMVPALGLMVPAANAATVVTHAPGEPGQDRLAETPGNSMVNCNASHTISADNNAGSRSHS